MQLFIRRDDDLPIILTPHQEVEYDLGRSFIEFPYGKEESQRKKICLRRAEMKLALLNDLIVLQSISPPCQD